MLEVTTVVVFDVCFVDSVDSIVEQLSPVHGVPELTDVELVCVEEVTVESELGVNPSEVVSCVVVFSNSVVSAVSDSVEEIVLLNVDVGTVETELELNSSDVVLIDGSVVISVSTDKSGSVSVIIAENSVEVSVDS